MQEGASPASRTKAHPCHRLEPEAHPMESHGKLGTLAVLPVALAVPHRAPLLPHPAPLVILPPPLPPLSFLIASQHVGRDTHVPFLVGREGGNPRESWRRLGGLWNCEGRPLVVGGREGCLGRGRRGRRRRRRECMRQGMPRLIPLACWYLIPLPDAGFPCCPADPSPTR